jgi:hypothetical protein
MLKYEAKIVVAFGETITGNDEILLWLYRNGFPELSALSKSIRGSEEAFDFLFANYPRLAALDAAIDNQAKAYLWLKKHNFEFNIIFADACRLKPQAVEWLKARQLEVYVRIAEKINHFRENQYFDYHKKRF